jgi:AraC-like DNA-binding protein
MEESFADDMGIEDLTRVGGVSASHLMRTFRRQVGIPIHSYLTQVRLRHAREMLTRSVPGAEVAVAVGFADQSHLVRRFKHVYVATPGTYVRESRRIG